MARIRSIHPGLFTDEAFVSASPFARLLIIGIWCEAFDDGCFEVKPLTLKMRVFPVDNVDVAELLAELEALGWFKRFSARGKDWGALRNFCRFQRPKKPNSSGVLPDDLRGFVGHGSQVPQQDGTGSEPVLHQDGTGSEKPPQMEDGGGSRRRETSSSGVEPDAREPAAAAEQVGLESRCRTLVGQEPVAVDPNFGPILKILDDPGITEADVIAGVETGLAKADPQYRFRHWRNFDGWIRGAAKDRLGNGKRAPPKAQSTRPPPDPNDPLIDMQTGFKRNESDLRAACRRYRENRHSWNYGELGPEPDQPRCRVPEHILVETGFREAAHAAA